MDAACILVPLFILAILLWIVHAGYRVLKDSEIEEPTVTLSIADRDGNVLSSETFPERWNYGGVLSRFKQKGLEFRDGEWVKRPGKD